jgi:hypothetical protein
LTVSVQRIGRYEIQNGVGSGAQALRAYFQPKLFQRIADARHKLVESMIRADPDWDEKCETLSENNDPIGYWQGEGIR